MLWTVSLTDLQGCVQCLVSYFYALTFLRRTSSLGTSVKDRLGRCEFKDVVVCTYETAYEQLSISWLSPCLLYRCGVKYSDEAVFTGLNALHQRLRDQTICWETKSLLVVHIGREDQLKNTSWSYR